MWNISNPELRDCTNVSDESIINTTVSGVNVLAERTTGSVAMSDKDCFVLAESISSTAMVGDMAVLAVLAESISSTVMGGMNVFAESINGTTMGVINIFAESIITTEVGDRKLNNWNHSGTEKKVV